MQIFDYILLLIDNWNLKGHGTRRRRTQLALRAHLHAEMDVQALTALFTTSYNPDPNVRKAGELQIRKVRVLSDAF